MQEENNPPLQIDPRLRGAVLHPRRIEILSYLLRKRDGTRELELGKALGLPFPQVEYHLKVLREADLIAQLEARQGREKAGRSFVAAGQR
jgi:DNA-binding transcriptional ArsR family regulator